MTRKDPTPPHVRQRAWARQQRLREFGYESYAEYLRAPHWQSVKARYRASDLPQVCMCGAEEVHLHHKTYDRVGEEQLTDLIPLCRDCHAMIHTLERRGEITLNFEGFESLQRAALYAEQQAPQIAKAKDEHAHGQIDEFRERWDERFEAFSEELLREVEAEYGVDTKRQINRMRGGFQAVFHRARRGSVGKRSQGPLSPMR